MAQFDTLIILPLIWSFLAIFFFHYQMSIRILIPHFFGAKKFREKKLNSTFFYNCFLEDLKITSKHSYIKVS